MHKEYINPRGLFNSTQFGFSQAVVSDPGKLVFISGQVSSDEQLQVIGGADMIAQARHAFENLKSVMEQAGGHLKDIVSLRLYIVDYREEDSSAISGILKEYFGESHAPASTWIGVKSLANNKFLIEVEAQAVLPA